MTRTIILYHIKGKDRMKTRHSKGKSEAKYLSVFQAPLTGLLVFPHLLVAWDIEFLDCIAEKTSSCPGIWPRQPYEDAEGNCIYGDMKDYPFSLWATPGNQKVIRAIIRSAAEYNECVILDCRAPEEVLHVLDACLYPTECSEVKKYPGFFQRLSRHAEDLFRLCSWIIVPFLDESAEFMLLVAPHDRSGLVESAEKWCLDNELSYCLVELGAGGFIEWTDVLLGRGSEILAKI